MTEYELEKNKSIYNYIKYNFEKSYVDFGQCWLSKNPQKISHQKGLLKSFSTHQKSSKSDYGAWRYPKIPESVFFIKKKTLGIVSEILPLSQIDPKSPKLST